MKIDCENEAKYKWSPERPKAAGYYWIRGIGDYCETIVEVYAAGYCEGSETEVLSVSSQMENIRLLINDKKFDNSEWMPVMPSHMASRFEKYSRGQANG